MKPAALNDLQALAGIGGSSGRATERDASDVRDRLADDTPTILAGERGRRIYVRCCRGSQLSRHLRDIHFTLDGLPEFATSALNAALWCCHASAIPDPDNRSGRKAIGSTTAGSRMNVCVREAFTGSREELPAGLQGDGSSQGARWGSEPGSRTTAHRSGPFRVLRVQPRQGMASRLAASSGCRRAGGPSGPRVQEPGVAQGQVPGQRAAPGADRPVALAPGRRSRPTSPAEAAPAAAGGTRHPVSRFRGEGLPQICGLGT